MIECSKHRPNYSLFILSCCAWPHSALLDDCLLIQALNWESTHILIIIFELLMRKRGLLMIHHLLFPIWWGCLRSFQVLLYYKHPLPLDRRWVLVYLAGPRYFGLLLDHRGRAPAGPMWRRFQLIRVPHFWAPFFISNLWTLPTVLCLHAVAPLRHLASRGCINHADNLFIHFRLHSSCQGLILRRFPWQLLQLLLAEVELPRILKSQLLVDGRVDQGSASIHKLRVVWVAMRKILLGFQGRCTLRVQHDLCWRLMAESA